MEIYSNKDIEIFNKKVKDIVKNVKKVTLNKFDPTKKDIEYYQSLIMNYIKKNKRKMYGGTALNEIIKFQNKNDVFYDPEIDLADYDIYSPDPINDICNICDLLADKDIKNVEGKEAVHINTYSIFVNGYNVLDVSYVPRNIYNKIPFKEIKDVIYVHPCFSRIDTFRMFTDPLISYEQRLEKQFNRFSIIEKYYRIDRIKKLLITGLKKKDNKIKSVLNDIHNFLINKNSIIVIDLYAYNYYLKKIWSNQ